MSAFTNARAIERLTHEVTELQIQVAALIKHIGYVERPPEALAEPVQAPPLRYWVKFFGKDRFNVLDRENAKQSRQWLSKDQAQDLCDKLNTEQAARRVA